ncbi:MAG: L-threonylcarbamoyladenylate synthase, partial [Marinosulfonomonas sp.]|nr:L-threonylcarbamoyladenylate synthase [Marinosulfonomonas sp.]
MPDMKTEILGVDVKSLGNASSLLRAGQLVAFPTETVYGLGADACNDTAVANIFAAKARPSFNPLIVHVATLEMAKTIAVFSEDAETLAARFWPGPLTLVLPLRGETGISPLVTAGLPSI